METVTDLADLTALILKQPGLVVLFGGANCAVCHTIKPKLTQMLTEAYPEIKQVYIDCQQTTDICAQNAVFSLPVVRVYFDGQLFIEKARSFSLPGLVNEMVRPYQMLFEKQ